MEAPSILPCPFSRVPAASELDLPRVLCTRQLMKFNPPSGSEVWVSEEVLSEVLLTHFQASEASDPQETGKSI